ncbi:DUF1735 domain-containing protein [Sphingobacterium sp. E70]|uniref:DUF1735 domain-containing protein n=1 Tax=Sphingobacterium sp. E70 TaxID=2853439 RepID=UPI00211C5A9F|nr:DUF1735 domain-containing protein [Sphingobacterium sp. E70]ULT25151.1 DUF1735 domain-containing protein [Sphingobacterium sp. E70]
MRYLNTAILYKIQAGIKLNMHTMKKISILYAMALVSLASCKNNDWEFPDFEFQSVYFAYQTPIRTVTLGEDIFDNSLDNQHKVKVMATTAGVYNNKKDIRIDFVVDNSLTHGLSYSNGQAVTALPDNYYRLASNQISIPSGSLTGGVEVQLTDAFFADPKSLETYYVLPLRMTKVANADSILSGKTSYRQPIGLLLPTGMSRQKILSFMPSNISIPGMAIICAGVPTRLLAKGPTAT